MNIYLAEEYEGIKDELVNRGYTIIQDNSAACDAIICNLKNCDMNTISNKVSLKREGALIIDCGSKTIEDIDYILNNRAYSNIF